MPTNTTQPAATPRHSRLQGQTAESLADYYSGKKLYGDDFSLAEIREWYSLEENACFAEVYDQGRKRMPNNDFLHWHCGYRWALNNQSLGKVLGLGSGNGEEFRPVRKFIEHLYIVESAEGYFQNDAVTTYAKAQVDGTLGFPDNFFDTEVNVAVLHHIPNASHVLRELFRVLKPGGT